MTDMPARLPADVRYAIFTSIAFFFACSDFGR
jgi:hypothetical protein